MFYIFLSFFLIILTNNFFSIAHQYPFDIIVSFGDGNTDTGNVYNLTNHQWPLVPPYYQGRFTNGPVWIEKLNISTVMSYAFNGATIDNDNLIAGFTGPNRTRVPGVRQQITYYLSNNDITKINLGRTLYVIWAGADDYLDNSSLTPDLVVNSLMDAVYDLVLVEIENLLIINLPPLQAYPNFNNLTQNSTLSQLVINHNNYLITNISQIQTNYETTSIKIFDLYSLITGILSNQSITTLNKINKCWTILNYSIVSQCTNPNNYVFIDDYHFTSSIHQTIADNIDKFLQLTSSSYHFSFSTLLILISIIIFIVKEN